MIHAFPQLRDSLSLAPAIHERHREKASLTTPHDRRHTGLLLVPIAGNGDWDLASPKPRRLEEGKAAMEKIITGAMREPGMEAESLAEKLGERLGEEPEGETGGAWRRACGRAWRRAWGRAWRRA